MLKRLLIVFTGVLLILTAASVWLARGVPAVPTEGDAAGNADGGAAIGGAFTLTDHNGAQVTDATYRGKHLLVFFGFTHCPDICPTTLNTLTHVMQELGDKGAQVQTLLITVDPERDTPQGMKEYLKPFHPSFVGLTGTRAQIEQAVAAYRVYAAKQEDAPAQDHSAHAAHGGAPASAVKSDYMVNHSGFIYFMGKGGEYVTHFSQEDSPEKIITALRERI